MGLQDFINRTADPDETALGVAEALMRVAEGGGFVDVRTTAEYQRGHIPGAKLVTITALQDDPVEAIWGDDPLAMIDPQTPEKTLVVVSSTPAHASAVAHLLRESGLTAHSLSGGLLAWVRDGQVLLSGPRPEHPADPDR